MKYKEKYKTGMIFRSKRNPWADIVIGFVSYMRSAEYAYEFNTYSIVCWQRANEVEFDKHVCVAKGYDYNPDENGRMSFEDKTTFPFPFFGEQRPSSMDTYIKKYELEFAGYDDRKVIVYRDDEIEFSSGFAKD